MQLQQTLLLKHVKQQLQRVLFAELLDSPFIHLHRVRLQIPVLPHKQSHLLCHLLVLQPAPVTEHYLTPVLLYHEPVLVRKLNRLDFVGRGAEQVPP